MKIELRRAKPGDCGVIRAMQAESFAALLEKYKDYGTNPACETVEKIKEKMAQPFTKYYFIIAENTPVGAVRVVEINESTLRISPILILPRFQGKGYAKAAMKRLEEENPKVTHWRLDTILQEDKLCRFYENSGYRQTGRFEDIQDGMTIAFYEKTCLQS